MVSNNDVVKKLREKQRELNELLRKTGLAIEAFTGASVDGTLVRSSRRRTPKVKEAGRKRTSRHRTRKHCERAACKKGYLAKRVDSRYCSSYCAKEDWRQKRQTTATPVKAKPVTLVHGDTLSAGRH